MKILITGGNGFIGSHLIDILIENNYDIRVFDVKYEQYREPIKSVEYTIGSFNDVLLLDEAMEGIDYIVHLISTSIPGTSMNSIETDISGNLTNTIHLLDLMRKKKIDKILFLSSGGTIYGNPSYLPIDENHQTYPISSYGIVKLAIEKYLYMYNKLYNIKSVIIRAGNTYGPRQTHIGSLGLIGTALTKMIKDEELTLYGNGEAIRDYLNVKDLSRICLEAIKKDKYGIYNAGSGCGFSIMDIINKIQIITGGHLKIKNLPGRQLDVEKNILDITKARKEIGWNPLINIDDGIKELYCWLKSLYLN